jgi:hypothetical protein
MRWLLLLTLLTVIGCAGPTPPPTPEPTAVPNWTIAGDESQPVRLMVQEGAYLMQERAMQERDTKTLDWIWTAYEYLDVPRGARFMVVQNSPSGGTQLEILDGPYAGRRGWLSSASFQPVQP